ncbi:MAG: hypothetical protein ACT4P3_03190 [Betaproteobacteria bacterium]
MHCELVVPGLFAAAPATRLPALELLLARGRGRRGARQRLEGWLAEAFGIEAPLPAGALSAADPGEAPWARADPVHLRLMRERLILVPAAAFAVSAAEAAALCEALSRHFSGLAFEPVQPGRWCVRLAAEVQLSFDNPLDLAGSEVGLAMPAGGHQLVNEAQMLLHAHPVNQAREARGEPAVNSVWLWGAGRAPHVPPARWQSVAADDPLALGLARAAGCRHYALPAAAPAWLERAPEEGRHLVVLDALRAPLALAQQAECRAVLEALERDWFAPLLAALRAGRVGMVTVQVPEGGSRASCETIRGDLRRFWRRPRALERYA